jgi:membrane protein DedA with SNARE-associated domain
MDIAALLATYGYLALSLGVFLEGETVLIMAGILVKQGYFQFPWLVLFGSLGAFIYTELLFRLGKRGKIGRLERIPQWQVATAKVLLLLETYQALLIIGFRFIYGVRTVLPFVAGISGYSPRKFMLFNALGTVIWTSAIGSVGYTFGQVVQSLMPNMAKYEMLAAPSVLVIVAAIWLVRRKLAGAKA